MAGLSQLARVDIWNWIKGEVEIHQNIQTEELGFWLQ